MTNPLQKRGRRECRVLAATHGPPATKKAGGSHHRFSRIIRPSLRDGFNGVLRAPPGTGLSCPVMSSSFRPLDTSVGMPGPHDFAVRIGIARLANQHVHRIPRSTFRDDRDTSLLPRQNAGTILLLFRIRKAKYFLPRGWTAFLLDCLSGKSVGLLVDTIRWGEGLPVSISVRYGQLTMGSFGVTRAQSARAN
jgi:hypothetical protein